MPLGRASPRAGVRARRPPSAGAYPGRPFPTFPRDAVRPDAVPGLTPRDARGAADALGSLAPARFESLRYAVPHRALLGDAPTRSWLAFNRSFGAFPRVAARALAHAGSPDEALRQGRALTRELRLPQRAARRVLHPDPQGVECDLEWLAAPRRSLLWLGHRDYPRLLSELPDPPPVLFVEGDAESLSWPMVAIVGSRNATPTGRDIAHDFARQLGAYGIGIVSGLALGVDAAAHRGALRTEAPTVAVCARGLDDIYPRAHAELARAVAARGAVVSEFPVGTPPLRPHFPHRNRIISGLSAGVLVVEASRRSGALITARQALEQGRDVFAVPGSIRNPLARGCHQLIRNGAKVVEEVQDILEELPGLGAARIGAVQSHCQGEKADAAPLGGDARRTLAGLGHESTPIDVLVGRVGLTADALSSILLSLELDGYVRSTPDGSYERVAGENADDAGDPVGIRR